MWCRSGPPCNQQPTGKAEELPPPNKAKSEPGCRGWVTPAASSSLRLCASHPASGSPGSLASPSNPGEQVVASDTQPRALCAFAAGPGQRGCSRALGRCCACSSAVLLWPPKRRKSAQEARSRLHPVGIPSVSVRNCCSVNVGIWLRFLMCWEYLIQLHSASVNGLLWRQVNTWVTGDINN